MKRLQRAGAVDGGAAVDDGERAGALLDVALGADGRRRLGRPASPSAGADGAGVRRRAAATRTADAGEGVAVAAALGCGAGARAR